MRGAEFKNQTKANEIKCKKSENSVKCSEIIYSPNCQTKRDARHKNTNKQQYNDSSQNPA